ncbi:MAG: CHRD domain-containing protein [Ginsengibacter sp.]
MIKTIKLLSAIMVFSLLFIGCTKDKILEAAKVTIFKAALTGREEVPVNGSVAVGYTILTYNADTKSFVSVTTYTGLTPTMGHIHKAAAGTNGPVIFSFPDLFSPITYTSIQISDEQVTALFKDSLYVNLHSATYLGGEIRGQLKKQ